MSPARGSKSEGSTATRLEPESGLEHKVFAGPLVLAPTLISDRRNPDSGPYATFNKNQESAMANKRDIDNARKNRLELIKAGFTRRDLVRMGLITSAGFLIAKDGLSSRAWAFRHGGDDDGHAATSPATRAFIEPLPILQVKQPVASLDPAPTIAPNTAAGERRTVSQQALAAFPAVKLYQVTQREGQVSMSPDLPLQTIWGYDGISPGPVYHARYGEPIQIGRASCRERV